MSSATIHRFRTLTIEQVLSSGARHLRLIILVAGLGSLAGITLSYLKTNIYRADMEIMPELQTRSALSFKGFGALAELAGLSLDGDGGITEAIRPDLYPNILESDTFRYEVLRYPVTTLAGKRYPSLIAFLTDPAHNWLARITGGKALTGLTPLSQQLTPEEDNLLQSLNQQLIADLNKQTGIIHVRVELPDPAVACQIAVFSIKYLRDYVTAYRTTKLQRTLTFLATEQQQARSRYLNLKRKLATYHDSHRNLFLQGATLESDQLEAETSMAQHVHQTLTEELEHTRLLIKEQMPVLKLSSPPRPPTHRSSPSRIVHGLAGGLLTGMLAFFAVVYQDIIRQIL